MPRFSIKVVGASGQGINSIGEILARSLKRSGYCVFGYREYPSIIKGGHASYQIDISSDPVRSTELSVDVLIALNHHGLEENIEDLKTGGVIIHSTPDWRFPVRDKRVLQARKVAVVYVHLEEILETMGAKPVLGNVFLSALVWGMLKQEKKVLTAYVTEKFAKKKELLAMNVRCVSEGYALARRHRRALRLPVPRPLWKKHLLLSGSEAMGLGAVHAGVRVYAGYPMSPSHPLLSFMATYQNATGMVMKQAEDEITAAQFVSGAMFMGARALTATSGGGFDLMTETVSMNGIIENPTVFVLAQRPGPATGLPTWTAQGDLLLAVGCAHGEFARLVLAVSDSQDCFDLMPEAFTYAEEFQTPVIVLTDKQTAEALFTQEPYDQKKAELRRGRLVTKASNLARLKGTDRYDPEAKDGISLRWLPGCKAATYCAQADEHSADGSVDETSANTVAQFEKRLRKMEALERGLPEPELYVAVSGKRLAVSKKDEGVDLLLVGWGSTKGPILDVLETLAHSSQLRAHSFGYLHYTYLWPLKTKRFEALAAKARRVVLVEGNYQGQLGMLLKQKSGIEIGDTILKYDGRPFFHDELLAAVRSQLIAHSS